MRVEAGEIIYFDSHQGMGHVQIGDERRVFIGTRFESGRWPQSGDKVKVVFNEINQIRSVRLASSGDHLKRVQ